MPHEIPRCQVIPLPDHQARFLIDGQERLRWHYGAQYPRPFFFPFNGPSGESLTRMGHPGAPDHDHHRSIWFAHHIVAGETYWQDQSPARIRQKQWLAYQDSDAEAIMATKLGWFNGAGREVMEQELVAALRPGPDGESVLELQSTLSAIEAKVELAKTNFGLLAVRVAKGLSAHFGGGRLTNSEGLAGEPAIFGQAAAWMDYTGQCAGTAVGGKRPARVEGITYFDHPSNPHHPAHWHVRDDGWMNAALCMEEGIVLTRGTPLLLRYLLHAHGGDLNGELAGHIARRFAASSAYRVVKSKAPHTQFAIERGG